MRIGIDFGTSYTAVSAKVNGEIKIVRFGDSDQFRTAVFFPTAIPDPADFILSPELEREVEKLVRSSKADQQKAKKKYERAIERIEQRIKRRYKDSYRINDTALSSNEEAAKMAAEITAAKKLLAKPALQSNSALRRNAIRSVRSEWMNEQVRVLHVPPSNLSDAKFGEDAIDAYISSGSGRLVQSPKSMLGYDLAYNADMIIRQIVTHFFQYIRLSACAQFESEITEAVVGRPVQFRSSLGERGSRQAINILTEGAYEAGFDRVEFVEEPVAAAYHYHRSEKKRRDTLVVDIGGGTMDVAYGDIGGRKEPQIHKSWGAPRGGTDIDEAFSLWRFMPCFGSEEEIFPIHHYVDAVRVADVHRQATFRHRTFQKAPQPYRRRLTALQREGRTDRLNRAVERMKIFLSRRTSGSVKIGYIERNLEVSCSRSDLKRSAEDFLVRLTKLLETAKTDVGGNPTTVFLTGGMSRAPFVQSAIKKCFPNSEHVIGDAALGVVSGLADFAAKTDKSK